jgi:general secretion pathway protein N
MNLRLTNAALVWTILSGATAAMICAYPAAADSVDQIENPTQVELRQVPPPQPQKSSPDVTTSVGNVVLAVPLSKLSMTRDRPIFSPSRRPPPPPAMMPVIARPIERAKPAEPENPPLVLVGTVVGEDSGIAVLVEQATENVVKLRVNESHQGWTLRSIQGREVTFQNDRKSSVLALAPPGGSEPASSQAALEPPKRLPRR